MNKFQAQQRRHRTVQTDILKQEVPNIRGSSERRQTFYFSTVCFKGSINNLKYSNIKHRQRFEASPIESNEHNDEKQQAAL